MAESNLCPCIFCGHRISKTAHTCPNCKEYLPAGVECRFCGRHTPVKTSYEGSGYQNYACKSCFDEIFSIPSNLRCPDCGAHLPNWTEKDFPFSNGRRFLSIPIFSCPSCGCVKPFKQLGGCICGMPVLSYQKITKEKIGESFPEHYYHQQCAAKRAKSKSSGCLGIAVVLFLAILAFVFVGIRVALSAQ